MKRAVLAVLGLVAMSLVWPAQAEVPPKPTGEAKSAGDIAVDQQILARQFRDFEQALLRLAQRLEHSPKPEDRERAANLKKAIQLASDSGVTNKFEKLISILKTNKALSIQELRGAMDQNKMLADDIRAIIKLLMADNRDDEIQREKKRVQDLIKALEDVIRKQKLVRAQTEAGKMDKDKVIKSQKKVTKETGDIAKAMGGKEGAAKKGDSKAKEPKKGDSKSGDKKGDSKKGDSKGDSKSGDKKGDKGDSKSGNQKGQQGQSGQQGKPGDKNQGKPQPANPNDQQPDNLPGRKQIQDANEYQKKAENNLDKEDRDMASKNQDKALKELEEARKKLEEILRQLREEEIERLLAALQARCERMLTMQIEVYDGTVRVDRAIGETPDKKATRADEQKALQLSDREQKIVDLATEAINLLQAEGSAVAFPEQFIQTREDMRHVTRRLGKADVGSVTQIIEQDIIATLKEMIQALKKQQQRMQANKNQQSQQGQPPNQKLIDLIAELKMIKSMQLRVNSRTRVYGEKYPGEQAADPDIVKELADLAQRQLKIYEVTDNIYKGKNK